MAKIIGPKKTNRYPDEFKIKAVQLTDHPDILAKDVAEDLGIHPIILYRWRKEYREGNLTWTGFSVATLGLPLQNQPVNCAVMRQLIKRFSEVGGRKLEFAR